MVAQEISLEDPPPFSSFATHRPLENWESPHTKLIDERWLELFLAKLRDIHDYQDNKSKLGSSSRRTEDPAADKAGPEKPDKSTKKPKGKGANKGGGDEKPSSTN